MIRRLLPLLPAAALVACGGARDAAKPTALAGQALCDEGARQLAERLGPELSAVLQRVPVTAAAPTSGDAPPAAPLACALVYTQVPEESVAEDLPPEEVVDAGLDHQLAVVVPEADGRAALHPVGPSAASPGPVLLTLSVRDVLADGTAALVVQEDHSAAGESWRGLRLFAFPGEGRAPRELLGEALSVETPEGLAVLAQWQTAAYDGRRAVVFEGAGVKRIYTWDAANHRFQFDEAATAAASPRPAPPSEQPPASAAEDVPPGEPAKASPGAKGPPAEKAEAADAPFQIPLP